MKELGRNWEATDNLRQNRSTFCAVAPRKGSATKRWNECGKQSGWLDTRTFVIGALQLAAIGRLCIHGIQPRSKVEGGDCDPCCERTDRTAMVTCCNIPLSLHRNDLDLLIGGLSAQDFLYPVLYKSRHPLFHSQAEHVGGPGLGLDESLHLFRSS